LVTGVSTLFYGGALTVLASGDALVEGDTFNLFDAANFNDSFALLNLPTLAEGLFWDTSRLAVDGTLRVAAPHPQFGAAVLSGSTLTLSGTGGAPGTGFRVLTATSITQPLATWTEAATGNFTGAGEFSVNITINPDEPQRFYSIVTP